MMQRANCSQKRSASSIYIITQSNAIEKRGSSMRSRDGILHLFFTVNKLKSTLMLNHGIRRLFMVALGADTKQETHCVRVAESYILHVAPMKLQRHILGLALRLTILENSKISKFFKIWPQATPQA
ncbi:hypothetical protein T4D_6225 [Trichinella pseudospiralis]|uniref:Uncharacterized protein n=1 Tax=Trichinella pseudospiralis TaxID=6337 RepID=A0A0V1FXB7_TRIPS|nr:hypothetical protein T4D_6225 [Trichinella pseudospiralis]